MQKIAVIENGLIPVYETSTGEKVIYGSELYRGLKIKNSYADWIQHSLDECKAIENEDYYVSIKRPMTHTNKCPCIEHLIKYDVARSIIVLESKGDISHE